MLLLRSRLFTVPDTPTELYADQARIGLPEKIIIIIIPMGGRRRRRRLGVAQKKAG